MRTSVFYVKLKIKEGDALTTSLKDAKKKLNLE